MELRFVERKIQVSELTSKIVSILQYRTHPQPPLMPIWSEWKDVPCITLDEEKLK